jgi:PEP-CTERM motif
MLFNLNEKMKNLYRAALLAALGIGSITSIQGAPNDLLVGFTDTAGSVTENYVIDLGQESALLAAAAGAPGQIVNLTGDFSQSLYNNAFASDGNNLNAVNTSVVGGKSSTDIFGTVGQLQTQNGPITPSQLGIAVNAVNNTSAGNPGILSVGSFSVSVAQSFGQPGSSATGADYTDGTGNNPASQLSSGQVIENLFGATQGGTILHPNVSGWSYLGTFIFNLNDPNNTILFSLNPVAVPEPATYGALAGAGLLLLSLRRQLNRKNI